LQQLSPAHGIASEDAARVCEELESIWPGDGDQGQAVRIAGAHGECRRRVRQVEEE
jgi:hypothetical protein